MRLDQFKYEFNKEYGLILREDERFQIYMNPSLYLEKNYVHLDSNALKIRVACEIQNYAHALLEKYLSGFVTSYLPLNVSLGLNIKAHFNRLRLLLQMLFQVHSSAKVRNALEGCCATIAARTLTSRDIARLICDLYILLPELVESAHMSSTIESTVRSAKPYAEDDYSRSEFLEPVVDLHEFVATHLSPYLLGFYVHGSLSTLDICTYSDLDTLMIIEKSILEDPDRLHELQKLTSTSTRFLYMVDILQHHGHFVIAEQDLSYYPETYFPLVLFRYSTALMSRTDDLQIKKRECRIENQHVLWSMCYSFRSSYCAKKFPKNIYKLKSYLSRLMLLPALYLQFKGRGCYKKLSFAEACPDFTPEEWSVVDTASSIRSKWRTPYAHVSVYRRLLRTGLNPLMVATIARTMSGIIPSWLRKEIADPFYERVTAFTERVNNYLVENGDV